MGEENIEKESAQVQRDKAAASGIQEEVSKIHD
jgi:hypothetical protein